LTNVMRRLELLYPNSHHLSIDEDDKNYTVKLSIRL
jgi:LytS/YehU family sensor histidine kinase